MEFVGTKFGANIKSLGSYLGTMENILFENVVLHDVEKAINIDLNGQDDDARVQTIRVKNVTFRNFTGDAKIAGTFTCPGPAGTCSGILLEDINITGTQKPNGLRESASAASPVHGDARVGAIVAVHPTATVGDDRARRDFSL